MITVRKLKELLNRVPDDAKVEAYEGEGIGLIIRYRERNWWINATPEESEDKQDEFEGTINDNP